MNKIKIWKTDEPKNQPTNQSNEAPDGKAHLELKNPIKGSR